MHGNLRAVFSISGLRRFRCEKSKRKPPCTFTAATASEHVPIMANGIMEKSENKSRIDITATDPAMQAVLAYHERSKHQMHRSAKAPGFMDWSNQLDPFRRYVGAEWSKLPLVADWDSPTYGQLHLLDAVAPRPLSLETLSLFFRHALSITAWKEANGARWALRANPSSGNLHPTEGYALLPALSGLRDVPAIYHYTPLEHGLELRTDLDPGAFGEFLSPFPAGSFVVALTSIYWREAWKYGERAFRYCQHDVGHALAALRFAAAVLGWRVSLIPGDDHSSDVLGVARLCDPRVEHEVTELFAVVRTTADLHPVDKPLSPCPASLIPTGQTWHGVPNVLSVVHGYEWLAIDEVDLATRPIDPLPQRGNFSAFPVEVDLFHPSVRDGESSASRIILGRRSAVDMDCTHTIPADTFFRMMARLIPTKENRTIPFDAIPWTPRIHLGVFVHRVEGLVPGLYALIRDPRKVDDLKGAMAGDFCWTKVPGCPAGLDLFLLKEQDVRSLAKSVSCGQDIAGDGAFSVGMFADYHASLREFGASFYRSLFWEAGMVGQVLYLEAEAAGFRATGIGCFFDDPVHELFGLADRRWQSLYHLAVGYPVEDRRLRTLPGYETR